MTMRNVILVCKYWKHASVSWGDMFGILPTSAGVLNTEKSFRLKFSLLFLV